MIEALFGYCDGLDRLFIPLCRSEIDHKLWDDDPDMLVFTKELREVELALDLTGNLDAPL